MSDVVSCVLDGCSGCRRCMRLCPHKAFSIKPVGLVEYLVEIDLSKCIGTGCLRCQAACRMGILHVEDMISRG